MKIFKAILLGALSINFSACSSFNTEESPTKNPDNDAISQKLKGEYKRPDGTSEVLTTNQMVKMLKGEAVLLKDSKEIKLSDEQLSHKEELTKDDITRLLKGESKK